MKKTFFYYCLLLLILFIGCGPELQTVINRDDHNRIILEAEIKGEVDTLWRKVYTYHFKGDPELAIKKTTDSSITSNENVDVDSAGQAAEETPPEPKVYPITADTTKKTFSSYAKGRAEGDWKTWWTNGNLKSEFTYIKNEIEGIYNYYDSLGTKVKAETYKKSILNGVLSDFNENGTLKRTTDYVKGKKTGLIKEYLEGVVLLEQKTMKKDSLDGEWSSWHDNGTKKVTRFYKNGTPVGNWIFNDEKGQWAREEQYKNGLAHGIWTFYDEARDKVFQYYTKGKLMAEYTEAKWPNGQIKEVPSFKNGLPDGTWMGYWPNGSTRYTLEYKEGEKNGNDLRYDSTGVLVFEVKYVKGIRNGMEKEYYSNGNPKRTARYKDNLLDGKTELFDSLGFKTETITYKDSIRNGKTTLWWPNGEAHQRLTYVNAILEGEYEEWDSLGSDIVKGDYVNGQRHKKWLYYDSNGRKEKFIFLDMDSVITDYKFQYYPNWQIVEEPSFSDDGIYDGKWESFYLDGIKKKDYEYDMGKKDKIWMSYYQDKRRQNYTFFNQDSLITDYDFKYYDNINSIIDSNYYNVEFYMNLKVDNSPTFKNMQIVEEPNFNKEGLFDGKWEAFFEDGEIWRTFDYTEGNKDKLWTVFYDSTGVKQSETNYSNDLKEGMYFEWYESIKTRQKEEGLYTQDIKHEIWTYWNEYQEKTLEVWDMGKLLHTYKYEYYENGQVKEEPSYKNGKMHGDWVRFFPNGDIKGTRVFREGLKEGLWVEYHRNPPGERDDIFAWKGKYIADKREGKWEWFWLNMNLQRVEVFKNDEILSQDCYERDGSGRKRECMEVRGPSSY